jgi:hypothetical protein
LAGFSAVAVRAGFGASDLEAVAVGGGVGFCAGAEARAAGVEVRAAGAAASVGREAASPGRAACVLDGCPALGGCDFGACELACAELANCDDLEACGAPDDCGFGTCEFHELIAGELTAPGASPCAFAASAVEGCEALCAAPGWATGCSGPLGCGMAGPLLSDSVRECESSPKLIVYDLNGGSSDEVGGGPAGTGAEAPFGPDNSSGTNNTIRMTRMIAPVSRSFTRSSTMGTKPLQSSGRQSEPPVRHMCRTLVYAKPLQCRTYGIDRAEDNNSVTGHCSRPRDFATLLDGRCERDLVGRQAKPLCQIRCRAAARTR